MSGGTAVLLATAIYFYVMSSQHIQVIAELQTDQPKTRVLITAGSPQSIQKRLESLRLIQLSEQSTIQVNLDRNQRDSYQILMGTWKHQVSWKFIPVYGTAWEIQEALVHAQQNQETLIIPLIPEQALKIASIQGNHGQIYIIPMSASLARRGIEFMKSYLGWFAPDFVKKHREIYYDYDSGI